MSEGSGLDGGADGPRVGLHRADAPDPDRPSLMTLSPGQAPPPSAELCRHALLTVDEMRRADRMTILKGTPGTTLMENAGRAVAETLMKRFPGALRVLILAGPGNNGGDGFVAARHLAEAGRDVVVALLGARDALKGDAAWAASAWPGAVIPLADADPASADIVVDALFGTGLARPLEGDARAAIERVIAARTPVVAVDVPSGLHGDTGKPHGTVARADVTVTFARPKIGHRLMPGRELCGVLVVADIGITDETVRDIAPWTFANHPDLWRASWPKFSIGAHKYDRGHALVVSGPRQMTGASRLAARAALRTGAGLVTIAGKEDALDVHAAHLTAVMLREAGDAAALAKLIGDDDRIRAIVVGPGLGRDAKAKALVEAAARHPPRPAFTAAPLVLDADAISVFGRAPWKLHRMVQRGGHTVLTPHQGEFDRVFKGFDKVPESESKLELTRSAARFLVATMVLKGADTVIAAADGTTIVSADAPSTLATAGSGDVLAGIIGGLLAQGMRPFPAAAAAVDIHARAAAAFGPGLTADDLPDLIPAALRELEAAGVQVTSNQVAMPEP